MHFLALTLDPLQLIESGGYLIIAAIIFAECGLMVGFFLPGDSLLFTAGVLASSAAASLTDGRFQLNIFVLLPLVFLAAVIGDQVGYLFGSKMGPRLFRREDSRFFHKKHLVRAEHFFEEHGTRTIIIARFIPIVRTFTPIVAGIGSMRYRTYLLFDIAGALLWAVGVTLAGYLVGTFLGNTFPVDKILLPLIAVIVLVSLLPALREYLKHRKQKSTGAGPEEETETPEEIKAEAEEIAAALESRTDG